MRAFLKAGGTDSEPRIKQGLEGVLREAINMGSQDNLTVVAVGLRAEKGK